MEYEKFIEVFQQSDSIFQVANELGLTEQRVSTLASKLRKKKIPLKYMRKNYLSPDKVKKLAELAEQNVT
jgi:hypothetical protein